VYQRVEQPNKAYEQTNSATYKLEEAGNCIFTSILQFLLFLMKKVSICFADSIFSSNFAAKLERS
jgi:hypothetical protein